MRKVLPSVNTPIVDFADTPVRRRKAQSGILLTTPLRLFTAPFVFTADVGPPGVGGVEPNREGPLPFFEDEWPKWEFGKFSEREPNGRAFRPSPEFARLEIDFDIDVRLVFLFTWKIYNSHKSYRAKGKFKMDRLAPLRLFDPSTKIPLEDGCSLRRIVVRFRMIGHD